MKPRPLRHIVMLAVPPVEELDIVGPWDVFATANDVCGGNEPEYKIELVTAGRTLSFVGDSGLRLSATRHYRAIKNEIDTLIVPGGTGPQSGRDPAVLAWLLNRSGRVRRMVSICTGAFLLARSGLLDGKRVTTHWMSAKELARQHPSVIVEPDLIYVQDGGVYTSAGVTAGIDLALALVEEDLGSEVALQVARMLVLYLRRPGGQNQFSALLCAQKSDSTPLRELQVWMAENLRQDLSVDKLAFRISMSPRNFARVFVRESGTTPARFVENLRVEASRQLLEATKKDLEEIASRVGFSSAEVMRRAFQRHLGVSPSRYRERFANRAKRN